MSDKKYSNITDIANVLTRPWPAHNVAKSVADIAALSVALAANRPDTVALFEQWHKKFPQHYCISLIEEMFAAADELNRGDKDGAARMFLDDVKLLSRGMHGIAKDGASLLLDKIHLITHPGIRYRVLANMKTSPNTDADRRRILMMADSPYCTMDDLMGVLYRGYADDAATIAQLRDDIVNMAATKVADEMRDGTPMDSELEHMEDMVKVAADSAVKQMCAKNMDADKIKAAQEYGDNIAGKFSVDKVRSGDIPNPVGYRARAAVRNELEKLRARVAYLEAENKSLAQARERAVVAHAADQKLLSETLRRLATALIDVSKMSESIKDAGAMANAMKSSLFSKNVKKTRAKIQEMVRAYKSK